MDRLPAAMCAGLREVAADSVEQFEEENCGRGDAQHADGDAPEKLQSNATLDRRDVPVVVGIFADLDRHSRPTRRRRIGIRGAPHGVGCRAKGLSAEQLLDAERKQHENQAREQH
jgi:hypothetical protein